MTPTAVDLVWDLAGRPRPVGSVDALLTDTPGTCAVSGQWCTRTADVGRALGTNFTDPSLWRAPSTRVGPAALWCCSGKPPATLRMWSIIAAPGQPLPPSHPKAWLQDTPGLCLTNRADPAPIAAILADPPEGQWLVTVATSGQKHVLPYGTVNTGRGQWLVRMETVTIASTPQQWQTVHAHALALRRAGVPADDVLAGRPPATVKTRAALTEWRTHATPLTPFQQSPLLELALWTITKETMR